ncbi:MAG: Lrp/AsnC ligand binding domain-containing protein [Euryarchaeota archaeon]|nr:Lrp/AsnC ligand binding domain-containing protein [Euryarchaeota archaeon]
MIIRKKYLFYALALTSSFIAAFVTTIDSYVGNTFFHGTDPIQNAVAFSFSLFFVGIIATFIIALILSLKHKGKSLGSKLLDPSFKRLRLIKKSELRHHLIAGLMNAINTIGYCALISLVYDPSVLVSFSQIVILYLLLMESITEKNIPTLAEVQSSIIVTFGAILASISLHGEINVPSLLIVFLIINPTWAFFSIFQRKLKMMHINGKLNDAINIRFWNVVFSFLFTTLIILFWDIISGSQYLLAGILASIYFFPWLFLTMSTTFFSYVLYIRSLGLGNASVNNAIRASSIIFAVPFSIILALYGLSPFSTDPVMLIIKVIGMILIVMGIITFALTQVKAYIFITLKPGHARKEVMNKLWAIPGVSHVTVTAGKYDFIVKVSTRTLVKGYERIIRRIDEIDEVQSYKWNSVLKDWENI